MNPKYIAYNMIAIAGTGLLLYAAGNGMLGSATQKVAQKITEGYGV